MATQRSSFSKLQRHRDKQAKAAAKRDRRQNRDAEPTDDDEVVAEAPAEDTDQLLRQLEEVHRQFDDGVIDFDTFEERKTTILSQLAV